MNHNDDMDTLAESLRRSVREYFGVNYYGRRIYAGTNLDHIQERSPIGRWSTDEIDLDHIQEWWLDEVEGEVLELDPLKPLQCRSANKRVNQQVDGSALDDFFNEFATE